MIINNLSILLLVRIARNKAGKDIIVYGGYKHFLQKRNKVTDTWTCTSQGSSRYCKAKLVMSKEKELLKVFESHNHPPPHFIIRQGVIIRI